MPIYTYTLFKYLKAPSTWIILALSMFIAGFLGGWLPFHLVAAHNKDSLKTYSMTVIGVVGGSSSFLAIFISVFAGFKAASMYKDEVEDGTFLIMLSKPRTRGRIIFEKWLALQTTMIVYSFLTISAFAIAIVANDPGSNIIPAGSPIATLTSKLLTVSLTMWAVLIVIGFIFTSIALLLSTKVSSGATIGITLAIGVMIPISAMISTFSTDPEYTSLKSDKFEMSRPTLSKSIKSAKEELDKLSSTFSTKVVDGVTDKQKADNYFKMVSVFENDEIYKDIEKAINGKEGLANLGLTTDKIDDFKKTYFFDLNYQVHSLSSMASDIVVPPAFAALTSDSTWGKISGLPLTTKVTDNHLFDHGQEFNEMIHRICLNIEPIIDLAKKGQELIGASGLFDYNPKFPSQEPTILPEFRVILEKEGKVDEVKSIIDYFHDMMVKPLSFVINDELLKSSFDPVKYAYKNINSYAVHQMITDELGQYFGNSIIRDQYGKIISTSKFLFFSSTERNIENELLSVAHYDDVNNTSSFAKVEKVSYANKFTILYIYLAIAALLVPLSYFIVRKQDFR